MGSVLPSLFRLQHVVGLLLLKYAFAVDSQVIDLLRIRRRSQPVRYAAQAKLNTIAQYVKRMLATFQDGYNARRFRWGRPSHWKAICRCLGNANA
jgi:hypothetical protein